MVIKGWKKSCLCFNTIFLQSWLKDCFYLNENLKHLLHTEHIGSHNKEKVGKHRIVRYCEPFPYCESWRTILHMENRIAQKSFLMRVQTELTWPAIQPDVRWQRQQSQDWMRPRRKERLVCGQGPPKRAKEGPCYPQPANITFVHIIIFYKRLLVNILLKLNKFNT